MRSGSLAGLRVVVLGVGVVRMVVLDVAVVRMMVLNCAVAGLIGGAVIAYPAIGVNVDVRVREDRGQRIERQRQPGNIKIPVDPHGAVGSYEQTRHFRAYSKAGLLPVNALAYSKLSREAAPPLLTGASATR